MGFIIPLVANIHITDTTELITWEQWIVAVLNRANE